MSDFAPRIPQVPSNATGVLADWCRLLTRQLNQEGKISIYSGSNPNTSGVTGLPGDLLVNVGSASTSSRLYVMSGGVRSTDTDGWRVLRTAIP